MGSAAADEIARFRCDHAAMRRNGRGTVPVSVEKPLRRFWMNAWPRARRGIVIQRPVAML
jgi:hypothetical protein